MALHFFRRLAGVVVGSACLMLWCTHAAAQTADGGCGTVETDQSRRDMLGMMESGQWEEARFWLGGESVRGVDAMVAMTMHVIRYDNGSEGLPQDQVDQCIVDLNSEVELTGLLFFQEGPTIYHDDSDLAESVYEDFCTIVNTGVVANTVNCYFIPVYEGLCGVASYPSSGCQGVTVANGCAATDWNHSTFTHEVGHYFNLRHTHSTSGGNECVDGSNCASAGDGFCDTPADPTLTGVVDWETCGYFGTEQDACGTGMQYDPDTTNIMSYSTKLCRTHLSTEQQSMVEWTALNNEHRTDELRYLGACCVETACSVTTAPDCSGSWLGDGTTCSGDPCGAGGGSVDCVCAAQYDVGDRVVSLVNETSEIVIGSLGTVVCGSVSGNILVEWDDCTTCHDGNNYCDCGDMDGIPGSYQCWYVVCSSVALFGEPSGACCVDTSCSIETSADCSAAGGTYLGDGSSCSGDPCGAGSNVWTVDDSGGADFYDIQSAVNAASDGDEILVYPGTYTSSHPAHVADLMGKSVWLHSSDGPETTIIDGESVRRGFACVNGETSATVIEGFTITSGYATGYDYDANGLIDWYEHQGGGFYCDASSPILTGCSFNNNNGDYGGGSIFWQFGDATILECTISDSEAEWGGGILVYSNYSYVISGCLISDNTANAMMGGGIYCDSNVNCSIADCTITDNIAGVGGGIGSYNDTILLTDTTVCGNTPDQINGEWTDGGGNTVADTCGGDPYGACCVGTSCSVETPADCTAAGGTYLGDGSSCSGDPCGSDPTGACCVGTSCSIGTDADCSAAGGTYLGDGSSCSGDPCSAGNTTWTVDDDGGADFDNIQSAVDAALDGDEILVYPGTYTSTGDNVVDMMGKAVWLHSSDGPETTIIDGEDGRRGIVCSTNETSGTVIEGFTITRGSTLDLLTGSNNNGAGMLCYFSSPILTNCVFTENNAIASSHNGGGLAIHGGSPSLTDCVIDSNTSYTAGGGIYTREASSFSLTNCTITNNSCSNTYPGGGIWIAENSIASLTNTTVCGNIPDQIGTKADGSWIDNGGNYVADTCSGDPTGACCVDTSCSIETAANCSAAGGTYLGDGSSCSGDPCGAGSTVWTVDDDAGADFYYIQDAVDAALDGHEILVYPGTYTSTGDNVVDMMGKAVWLHSSDGPETTIIDGEGVRRGILSDSGETAKTMIEGFTIQNCYATPYAGWNNFRLGGGALIISSPTISNCIFDNNFAEYIKDGYGGGLFYGDTATQCDSVFTDCIFTNNTSDDVGGGVFGYNGTPEFVNCTIMGNTSYASGGGMYSGNDTPILTNCFITNNTAPYGGGIRSDNNLILFSTTVCGNTPDQIEGPWTDGGGNTVSDECPPDCPDVDGDGMVNVNDLLIVIAAWGLNGPLGDVNQDGIVGVNDLLIVIANWGPCP